MPAARFRLLALVCCVSALAGCVGGQVAKTPPPPAQNVRFGHVFIVVEENHNYADVVASPSMPYLNSLANQYRLAANYFANAHPSIPNYFELTTGQTLTLIDALTPHSFPVSEDNVIRELDRMNPTIGELTAAAEQEAKKRPEALRLMTHPGVGPLTALAYVLIIGTPSRFHRGKQIGNYVGMIPSENSSAGKQRLGHITKQGNSLLRFLLVEAAQAAARVHPDWRRRYVHLAMRRHRSIAKVAMGRRLGVRLYWMWRNGCEYSPSMEFGSYAGQLVTGHGVN